MLDQSILNLNETFLRQEKYSQKVSSKVKKLTPLETYIALIKGYCVITIIMLPKAFVNGGWAISAAMLLVCGILTTLCVTKLVDSGLAVNLFSYSLVAERAFGWKGKLALDIMITLT